MYRVLYSSLYIFGSRHQRLAIRNFFKLLNISLECPHLLLVFLEIQVAVLCTSIMTMPGWGMLKIASPKFLLLFLLFLYVMKSWLSIKKLFKNGMLIIFFICIRNYRIFHLGVVEPHLTRYVTKISPHQLWIKSVSSDLA